MIAGRPPVLNLLLQAATPKRGSSVTSVFRHFGALGLFLLAILDSSPLPTFGGPDILIAILAARQTNAWYELAGVATVGSVIGAYLTFRLARKAGSAYLNSKFGKGRVSVGLGLFESGARGFWLPPPSFPFRSPPACCSRRRVLPATTRGNISRLSRAAARFAIRRSHSWPITTDVTSCACSGIRLNIWAGSCCPFSWSAR